MKESGHILKTNTKRKLFGIILDLLSVGLVYFISQLVIVIVISLAGISDSSELELRPKVLLTAYIASGISILLTLYVLLKVRKINISILQFKKPRWGDFGYGLIGFGTYFLITLVLTSLLGLIPGLDLSQRQELGLQNIDDSQLLAVFFALVVLPPLTEELLFRGFLYGRLKHHRVLPYIAATITSLVFGLVHGQLNVGIDTFILSMVMVYILEIRKNIWTTIFMHTVKNAVAFLALFVFKIV